jgi:hypothetical protein
MRHFLGKLDYPNKNHDVVLEPDPQIVAHPQPRTVQDKI